MIPFIFPRSKPPTHSCAPKQSGYVLLFALGLMVVVATLVLSASVTSRLDVQLLSREKSALQEEYLLRGAAHYTAIQLGITSAVSALQPPPSNETLRQWILWRPTDSSREITLDAEKILVELADVSGLPDANMLSLLQWERLFLLLGADSPESAKKMANLVMELREQLIRTRGTAGFSSIQELLEWKAIPSAMIHGGTKKVPLGLKQLLVVGTRNKQVDLNSTPLPLLQVLGNVTDEQIQQLATLRKSGPIMAAQAQQWLQGTGLVAQAAGALPNSVTARLRMASSPPDGLALVAVIANESGRYVVVDQAMDKGTTGQ